MNLSITTREIKGDTHISLWRRPDQYQYMLRLMTTLEKRSSIKKARENNCRVHIDFYMDKKVNIKLRKLRKMLQEEQ